MNEGIREQLSAFSKRNSCGPIVFPSFYMPCFSIIRDKDARKRVFFCHRWENKRIKFLGCSIGDALYKSPGIKFMHGRIPRDFVKPLLIFRIESNSRTIYSTAVEHTLTSTQNYRHAPKSDFEFCCLRVNLPTVKIWGWSDKFPMSFSPLRFKWKNWFEKTALSMSIRRVIFTSGHNLKPRFFCQYLIFFSDFFSTLETSFGSLL